MIQRSFYWLMSICINSEQRANSREIKISDFNPQKVPRIYAFRKNHDASVLWVFEEIIFL